MKRCLALLLTCLFTGPAWTADTDDRLAFIESSLDENQRSVRLWQEGWSTVYTAAAIGYAGMALDANDRDERTVRALGAVRAALAATLLNLRPHPGAAGAEPIRRLGDDSPGDRLAEAERILEASAWRTDSKRRPARHLRNLLVNAGFGAAVWALGDRDDALPFTLMGIAGGEALLLTLPEQPRRDLAEYRQRFGAAGTIARSMTVIPMPGGIRVQFAIRR